MNQHNDFMDVFYQVFEGMQRQGPGSEAATMAGLQQVMATRTPRRILEMGCGTGMTALLLARVTGGEVLALDNHQPFLDQLQKAATAEGLDRLQVICSSMDEPDKLPGTFDLIWSEGSAYIIGVERALEIWRPLLNEGGFLYISDMVLLTKKPAVEVCEFFEQEGVQILTLKTLIRQAQSLGYTVVNSLILSQQDWFDFYADMQHQINRLAPQVGDDHPALQALQQEIAIYQRHGDQYSYGCLLLRKT